VISARAVSYRAGGRDVLHAVSLSVHPGRVLALAGPNGAGKSTLLGILSGDLAPAAGEVRVLDRPARSWVPRELARLRAVLPQHDGVRFPLPAGEVVALGRAPWREVRSERHREVTRLAMQATRVEHLAARCFLTLSGGERQRVHLARVLAQLDPWRPGGDRFLFLDEPAANLDPAHQHETLGLVRRLARGGCGALVVLHDLNLASQYADDVALMNRGRLVAHGPPAAVLTARNVREVYGLSVQVLDHPRHDRPLLVAEAAPEAAAAEAPGAFPS
jgi:iron complex transport system ATP-binding protein